MTHFPIEGYIFLMSQDFNTEFEEDQEYEVQKILNKRVTKDDDNSRHIFYLVHWKGYLEKDATWQPAENLQNAIDKVKAFERKIWQNSVRDEESKQQLRKSGQQKRKAKQQLKQKKGKVVNKKGSNNQQIIEDLISRQPAELPKDFQIVGMKRSQIYFFINSERGIEAISSTKLKKQRPYKIIQFYQKHLRRQ